jgi:hypothetical protein
VPNKGFDGNGIKLSAKLLSIPLPNPSTSEAEPPGMPGVRVIDETIYLNTPHNQTEK